MGQPWRISAIGADGATAGHNLAKRFPHASPSISSRNSFNYKPPTCTPRRDGSNRSVRSGPIARFSSSRISTSRDSQDCAHRTDQITNRFRDRRSGVVRGRGSRPSRTRDTLMIGFEISVFAGRRYIKAAIDVPRKIMPLIAQALRQTAAR